MCILLNEVNKSIDIRASTKVTLCHLTPLCFCITEQFCHFFHIVSRWSVCWVSMNTDTGHYYFKYKLISGHLRAVLQTRSISSMWLSTCTHSLWDFSFSFENQSARQHFETQPCKPLTSYRCRAVIGAFLTDINPHWPQFIISCLHSLT